MTAPAAQFDTMHPSGHVMFRSCRGGYLHSVVIGEAAMDSDAQTVADAILLAGNVSFLKAENRIRGNTDGEGDLEAAQSALASHRLRA